MSSSSKGYMQRQSFSELFSLAGWFQFLIVSNCCFFFLLQIVCVEMSNPNSHRMGENKIQRKEENERSNPC